MSRTDGLKIVALTAPSGAGKTTIARKVLRAFPDMQFSVSATTRAPRPGERDGVDYHFISHERFLELVEQGEILEYEEVYPGRLYGTLRSEVEQKGRAGPVLLDVDVKGARSVERLYGDSALTVFIEPPSLARLAERLRARGTETEHALQTRLDRAQMELQHADQFDVRIVNDQLDRAVEETLAAVRAFLAN